MHPSIIGIALMVSAYLSILRERKVHIMRSSYAKMIKTEKIGFADIYIMFVVAILTFKVGLGMFLWGLFG